MKRLLIAERYGLGLAKSLNGADALESALASLEAAAAAYQDHAGLRGALLNPAVPISERAALLEKLIERLGLESGEVSRLLSLLLQRGRLMLLPDVLVVFSREVDRQLGRGSGEVRSAAPLSDEQKNRLQQSLERFAAIQLHLRYKVEPALMGGVVAKVGTQIIDGSVRSKLARLRDSILSEEG